ncbi:hypothetical protein ACEZDB_35835 [Streptacidiphilus sp. N1-3]|uniref:Uncharacterized protein n=1 Tax=Streptacidiphilus alkalitolerans TaxID=3342712 RepID=A0ABV6XD82_9ACTN
MSQRTVVHYMATRPDGTVPPYYEGAVGESVPTVNLADLIGQDVDHPDPGQKWYTDKPFSYFLMYSKTGEVLENSSLQWPVRMFIVESRGETGNWGGRHYPYWQMSHQLHVVGETDAWLAFGPRGRQVVDTLAQLPDLTGQWSTQWDADPERARQAHTQWWQEVNDRSALNRWATYRAHKSRRAAALTVADQLASAAATESARAVGATSEAIKAIDLRARCLVAGQLMYDRIRTGDYEREIRGLLLGAGLGTPAGVPA